MRKLILLLRTIYRNVCRQARFSNLAYNKTAGIIGLYTIFFVVCMEDGPTLYFNNLEKLIIALNTMCVVMAIDSLSMEQDNEKLI